jgi:cephalosporin hydroxylase
MNDLERYFHQNTGPRIYKWLHYFEIYEQHLERFRNQPVHVLEIGVGHGGSLRMWRDYFGSGATIHGVDINPHCKQLEDTNIRIYIGSQEDRRFLSDLRAYIPHLDIVIDDGGHRMQQQIIAFEELYPHVAENGVYVVEDVHTSYWRRYGGGYRNANTFIEYSKRFIDYLNAWHSKEEALKVSEFTRTTFSLHFYDSLIVFEKRQRQAPRSESHGRRTL